jgi:hypothetical protein
MEYLEPSGALGMDIWRPLMIGENIQGLGQAGEPARGAALGIIRPKASPRLPSQKHMERTWVDLKLKLAAVAPTSNIKSFNIPLEFEIVQMLPAKP